MLVEINPRNIDSAYRETIVEIANNMKKKALKDYASTKHKKLPERVKEGAIKDIYYHLSPDAEYDPSKEKSRRPGNLADYREFIKKNKSK